MTRSLRILLATAVCALPACSYAQTANKIIDRHIRALGGSKALSQIHTRVLEGELVRPEDGKNGFYTVIAKTPNLLFSEVTVGEEHISEAFNGKSAWRRDSTDNVITLTGDEATLLESVAVDRNSRLLKNNSKDQPRAKFAGQELVQGRPAFRVEFVTQKGAKRTVSFDAQNYLMVKDRIEVGGQSEETSYSGYQRVDGVMEPSRIELRRGEEALLISNIRVRHNSAVDNAAFDFPASSKEAVPDATRLLTEIQENQKATENILENYTYRKVEEETDVDDQSRVKGRHKSEYEVFYVDGREIQSLVSKEGIPLPPAERQKEDEKTRELVVKYERAARTGKPNPVDSNNDEDELHISTFLRACRFSNARRERFRGQPVIVFDIQPNPAYRPQNLNERLAQKLEGVMWVDERAHQVVRLEARLADSAKIGGGLLGTVNKGSAAIFEQTLVNNEVWLPSYVEEHLAGRYLLFKGYRENLIIHYNDYKKFRVETGDKPGPPRPNEP